jgi:hypothetical protein
MPLVHQGPDNFLESNILLNTGVWKTYSYSQYVFSTTTAAPTNDVKKFFGCYFRNDDTPWARQYWSNDIGTVTKASRESLTTTWLHHRFYVFISLPPERTAGKMMRVNYPTTIALLFVALCDFLIDHRGYPAHWIVSILDQLLQ